MAYTKPQAIIHQQFTAATSATADTLRAVIVGPNAILHRYNVTDEKEGIYLTDANGNGNYDMDNDATYSYPGRTAGGIVDDDSVKLFIDNALLEYYSHDGADESDSDSDSPTFCVWKDSRTSAPKYNNAIVSNTVNLVTYDTEARNANLKKDVEIGDYAWVTAIADDSDSDTICDLVDPLLSRIVNLIYDEADSSLTGVSVVNRNHAAVASAAASLSETINGTATTGTALATVDSNYSYNGYSIGYPTLTYTVSAIKKTSVKCGTQYLAHYTCSTTGEDGYVEIKDNTQFKIGVAEVPITVASTTSLGTSLATGAVVWTIELKQVYSVLTPYIGSTTSSSTNKLEIGGTYNGGIDDVFNIVCTQGGSVTLGNSGSGTIKVSVSTLAGNSIVDNITLDKSLSTTALSVGTCGITLKAPSDQTSLTMYTGQVIQVTMKAPYITGVKGVMLADDLPTTMRSDTANIPLSVKFLQKDNIEISPSSTTFTVEDTQVVVKANMTYKTMPIISYDSSIDFNKMYLEYREWSPAMSNALYFCESVSALDAIPGALDPENPLKYGVYKALANSNGSSVGYVSVKDPEDLDSWQDAVSILEGRDDIYTVVPMTTDITRQNLINTLVQNESGAEACHWKTAIFSITVPTEKMVVGQSATNATTPTSTDGLAVLGNFVDNDTATGTQYTKLVVTSNNSNFINYGVQPGDLVKVYNSLGTAIVGTYTVDTVVSATTLLVMSGPATAQSGVKIEVWHTFTKPDTVKYIQDYAQSFADRRIGLCWPDIITEGGVELPGYYLAAALAGLKSGVDPVQSLTRVEVSGFDGFTRSRPYFTESQLNELAGSGVWIVMEDSDGTPYSRHAINTSTKDINYREEMMTRNFDSICKYLYQIIDPYIGVTIINQDTLYSVYYGLKKACDYLITQDQINSYSDIRVKQHDLLSDRIEAYITASLPYATNNVELYVTAERAELETVTLGEEEE